MKRLKVTRLGILLMAASTACFGKDRPLVGAIRWDAWTGGNVTKQVERTLEPQQYHNRLPWFARVLDDGTVKIDGSPQGVMDKEIVFATSAGIDYWAFLIYPQDSSMTTALEQYFRSPKRTQVQFCMILHNTFGAQPDVWPKERDRAVALLSEPGYQKVLGYRPLVYLFGAAIITSGRFEEWLAAARKKGHNPYCVFMGRNPPADYKKAKPKGFDAVSAYACGSAQPKFAQLVKTVESNYWERAAKAKVPYIPLVSTGWNKEPRKDNPVSWEKNRPYHKQKVFTSVAKPREIANHLKKAFAFVHKHPDLCEANAVIVYAWNEYDEGGWLAPTRGSNLHKPNRMLFIVGGWLAPTRGSNGKPDNGRLDAIRKALKRENVTQQSPADDSLKAAPEE